MPVQVNRVSPEVEIVDASGDALAVNPDGSINTYITGGKYPAGETVLFPYAGFQATPAIGQTRTINQQTTNLLPIVDFSLADPAAIVTLCTISVSVTNANPLCWYLIRNPTVTGGAVVSNNSPFVTSITYNQYTAGTIAMGTAANQDVLMGECCGQNSAAVYKTEIDLERLQLVSGVNYVIAGTGINGNSMMRLDVSFKYS